jgi:hypothetical protein
MFKEADVTRAFKAAKKAGVMVEIKVSLDRREMTIKEIEPNTNDETNEWDEQ